MGVVSTSDSLDASPLDLELLRAEGAAVKEMEAASIAWVCEQLAVNFFALKSITDIVDHSDDDAHAHSGGDGGDDALQQQQPESETDAASGDTRTQFERNLEKASNNLQVGA